jgi:hypothetical protein
MIWYIIGCIIAFVAYWFFLYKLKQKQNENSNKDTITITPKEILASLFILVLSWAAIIIGGGLLFGKWIEERGDEPLITVNKKKSE